MTPFNDRFLKDAAIIVCHPDDETLWFGSIVADVGEVIIAYEDYWARPELGAARRAALAAFPRRVTSLGLPEAGSYGLANWANPEINAVGIAFKPATRSLRELKRRTRRTLENIAGLAPQSVGQCAADRYAANFHRLDAALRKRLRRGMNVFTHNPWGEYGHEDHIQMFRVLDGLRDEIGFTLWMSNYCTERSLKLAGRYFTEKPPAAVRMPVNKAFCDKAAQAYRDAGCWTWADDWAWFDDECFMEAPRLIGGNQPHRHLFPLNMFWIDNEAPDRWMLAATAGLSAAGMGLTLAMADFG